MRVLAMIDHILRKRSARIRGEVQYERNHQPEPNYVLSAIVFIIMVAVAILFVIAEHS